MVLQVAPFFDIAPPGIVQGRSDPDPIPCICRSWFAMAMADCFTARLIGVSLVSVEGKNMQENGVYFSVDLQSK